MARAIQANRTKQTWHIIVVLLELLHGGLKRHLKPGFRALFYGPSGTGKTLTASLLGQELGVEYIASIPAICFEIHRRDGKKSRGCFHRGGTAEMDFVFRRSRCALWQRTQTSSAHDRYANQEVSFLLQRVEDHPGIAILATNLKSNLDGGASAPGIAPIAEMSLNANSAVKGRPTLSSFR